MEKEPVATSKDQQFKKTIENLSFVTSRVLSAVLIREIIDDLDEFRHVADITDKPLGDALEELKKADIIEEKNGRWKLTAAFSEYWERTKKIK